MIKRPIYTFIFLIFISPALSQRAQTKNIAALTEDLLLENLSDLKQVLVGFSNDSVVFNIRNPELDSNGETIGYDIRPVKSQLDQKNQEFAFVYTDNDGEIFFLANNAENSIDIVGENRIDDIGEDLEFLFGVPQSRLSDLLDILARDIVNDDGFDGKDLSYEEIQNIVVGAVVDAVNTVNGVDGNVSIDDDNGNNQEVGNTEDIVGGGGNVNNTEDDGVNAEETFGGSANNSEEDVNSGGIFDDNANNNQEVSNVEEFVIGNASNNEEEELNTEEFIDGNLNNNEEVLNVEEFVIGNASNNEEEEELNTEEILGDNTNNEEDAVETGVIGDGNADNNEDANLTVGVPDGVPSSTGFGALPPASDASTGGDTGGDTGTGDASAVPESTGFGGIF